MSIRTAKLSPGALETIRSQVSALSTRSESTATGLSLLAGAASDRTLQTAAPHDVYNLPLTALASHARPEDAEAVGVRCLIVSNDEPIATAELPEPDGREGAITQHGPFTRGTVEAIHAVEESGATSDGISSCGSCASRPST